MTPRDIEKLKAIGIREAWQEHTHYFIGFPGPKKAWTTEWAAHQSTHSKDDAVAEAKAYVQSPEGMRATMADKVRFLGTLIVQAPANGLPWYAARFEPLVPMGTGESPEAAVDALFWKVP